MRKWDKRMLELAFFVANWSKDPSTKVGAVVADPNNRVVSLGYNGPPRGTEDRDFDRETKLRRTIHAEENAILFAHKSLEGCTLFVTHHPCATCAAKIAQVGISRVVTPKPSTGGFHDRWLAEIREALSIFDEAGIEVCHGDKSL